MAQTKWPGLPPSRVSLSCVPSSEACSKLDMWLHRMGDCVVTCQPIPSLGMRALIQFCCFFFLLSVASLAEPSWRQQQKADSDQSSPQNCRERKLGHCFQDSSRRQSRSPASDRTPVGASSTTLDKASFLSPIVPPLPIDKDDFLRVPWANFVSRHYNIGATVSHAVASRRAKASHPRDLVVPDINSERATQIQLALIKNGYLAGAPPGVWNATSVSAMRKLQADHGWQTKLMPDSRALIYLGLGPQGSSGRQGL